MNLELATFHNSTQRCRSSDVNSRSAAFDESTAVDLNRHATAYVPGRCQMDAVVSAGWLVDRQGLSWWQ